MRTYTKHSSVAEPVAGGGSGGSAQSPRLLGNIRDTVVPVSSLTYGVYLLYAVFFFLNIPSRFPVLGVVRPTVLLAGLVTLLLILQKKGAKKDVSGTSNVLIAFIAYSLVSLPFVEWPGSVLRVNLQDFIKVAVFFFFTVHAVDTPRRLRQFVALVVGLQVIRVLEPLYLHITEGYWGSRAHIGYGEFLGRLSGAPSDVINPNGLAFVILTALPFLYYLCFRSQSRLWKFVFLALLPCLIWTLMLTGSRSGLIGLAVVLLAIAWKSKHKAAFVSTVVIGGLVVAPMLSSGLQDRYMSLFSDDTSNAGTVEGRIDGLWVNLYTGLEKPVFGHGLGTSLEAAWHFNRGTHVAHNLYLEAFIETGIIGLGIYCAFLLSILTNYRSAMAAVAGLAQRRGEYWADYYFRLADAIRAFAIMCLVFSIAMYGIREFHWYLVGGLSVVLARLATELRRGEGASSEAVGDPARTPAASMARVRA